MSRSSFVVSLFLLLCLNGTLLCCSMQAALYQTMLVNHIYIIIHSLLHVACIFSSNRSNGDLYTSAAYATVGRHLICGEERVTAILRQGSDTLHHCKAQPVHVEILSYSRSAASFVGKLVWPLIGRMQSQFFEAEMKHFVVVGDSISG